MKNVTTRSDVTSRWQHSRTCRMLLTNETSIRESHCLYGNAYQQRNRPHTLALVLHHNSTALLEFLLQQSHEYLNSVEVIVIVISHTTHNFTNTNQSSPNTPHNTIPPTPKPTKMRRANIVPTKDEPLTIWAWTGNVGERVSSSAQLATLVATDAGVGGGTSDRLIISNDPPKDALKAPFGSTVVVTLQLVGELDSGGTKIEYRKVGAAGYKFNVALKTYKDLTSNEVDDLSSASSKIIANRPL